jgi:hypothetical protein
LSIILCVTIGPNPFQRDAGCPIDRPSAACFRLGNRAENKKTRKYRATSRLFVKSKILAPAQPRSWNSVLQAWREEAVCKRALLLEGLRTVHSGRPKFHSFVNQYITAVARFRLPTGWLRFNGTGFGRDLCQLAQ